MVWLIILTSILAYLIYLWIFKPMNYWKDKSIPYRKPMPIVGNLGPIVFRRHSLYKFTQDLYNEFPDKRLNGIFFFQSPTVFVRDLELIKQITIKDFDNFLNHTKRFGSETDLLLTKSLFMLEDQHWRTMRATLSPSFTGSKMKIMFDLIADCADHFTKYFEKDYTKVIEVDMKDVSSRFTNDVIATTAFGIKIDSLNDKDNEFFRYGREVSQLSVWRSIVFLVNFLSPSLAKTFNISVFSTNFMDFFQRAMKETIESREKHGIVRPDMVQLLLESRKEASRLKSKNTEKVTELYIKETEKAVGRTAEQKLHILTDEDITAQGMIFFVAGFDTVSSLISFMSYELALNVDVQKKLQKEIDNVLKTLNGKVTYEALMGMKYLDMVISESLRKWPPNGIHDRVCTKDYIVEPTSENEQPFVIQKGVSVFIPVAAIHYDPQYFPNPEKFDPERFSEENKSNIVPSSYMPFSAGPRICIASRFALMEAKILCFHLLSKFTIVPVKKTVIPLKLGIGIAMTAEGGFNLGFEKRCIEIN